MRVLSFALLCCLLFGATACAGGGGVVSPDLKTEQGHETSLPHQWLWGVYDVSIDPVTLQATVLPSRTAEVRMNVVMFMNMNPTSMTLQITDASQLLTEGLVTLDVTLAHPVPDKPKLSGFDVHCVLLTDSANYLDYDSTLLYADQEYNPVLLNPDGWTRWYNAQEFTGTLDLFNYLPGNLGTMSNPLATLNPYKLYADGLAPTADVAGWLTANQDNRAIFTSGSENIREFQMKFPLFGGQPFLKFQYAVAASWAKPSVDDPEPSDFPPEANIGEAAHLRIDTADSTMYWTVDKEGGDLVLNVDIFDWQGGDDIEAEILRVIVESDALSANYVDDAPTLDQTPGSAFGTWSATIPAGNLSSTDDVVVWVIVESADPTDYSPGPPTDYPTGKALAALNWVTASVDDVAPPDPPVLISGIDCILGTDQCPDRAIDNAEGFEVVVQASLPLTYSWTLYDLTQGIPISGFDAIPGNGDGTITIDFTSATFAGLEYLLSLFCEITDDIHDPIYANDVRLYLDCILYHADLEDEMWKDNMLWFPLDVEGTTEWEPLNVTDNGTNLTGTGALFQTATGGVTNNSKGLLLASPCFIPDFLTSATVEILHSYSFDDLSMGGNIKAGEPGYLLTVAQTAVGISSGHGYDGQITDTNNPMYGQSVFSADVTGQLYLSTVDVLPIYIGGAYQLGFAAASGDTSDLNGGWLIDEVKIIGTI